MLFAELRRKSFEKRNYSDFSYSTENVLFKTKINIGYHGEFDPGSG